MIEKSAPMEFRWGIGREDRALLGSNSSAHADAVNPWEKDILLPGMNRQNQMVYGQKVKNPGVWGRAPRNTAFSFVFWKMLDRCNICEDLQGWIIYVVFSRASPFAELYQAVGLKRVDPELGGDRTSRVGQTNR